MHITLSMPTGECRKFFYDHRFKLSDLANAAYSSLKYAFKRMGIIKFGAIINIHTFSRTVDWNPHIHAIVTLGGYTKNDKWKNIEFLPWKVLRESWQKTLLDIIYSYAKETNSTFLKNIVNLMYNKYKKGFYVNAEDTITDMIGIAKYLGRYLARPAIADYRITNITDTHISFWYKNPDSDTKIFLTKTIDQFLENLLSHIPPKNFKLVRRFGIYARRNKKKPGKKRLFKRVITWAERMLRSFNINPLVCPKCLNKLEILLIAGPFARTIYSNPNFP